MPPVLFMITPFMVLGMEEAMVLRSCKESAAARCVGIEVRILLEVLRKDMSYISSYERGSGI